MVTPWVMWRTRVDTVNTLSKAKAETLGNTLGDRLADPLSEAEAQTLGDTLVNMDTKAVVDTVSYTEEAEAKTIGDK